MYEFLLLADHGQYEDVVLLDDRERMYGVIRSGENADLAAVLLGLGARELPGGSDVDGFDEPLVLEVPVCLPVPAGAEE